MTKMKRCLDCSRFVGKLGARSCPVNPIPRKGTCGRCGEGFSDAQLKLEEVAAQD